MTLVGILKDGTQIERIKSCEFEGSPANSPTQWNCNETAIYRVAFNDGEVLHACEEHAQQLWDREEALTGETNGR